METNPQYNAKPRRIWVVFKQNSGPVIELWDPPSKGQRPWHKPGPTEEPLNILLGDRIVRRVFNGEVKRHRLWVQYHRDADGNYYPEHGDLEFVWNLTLPSNPGTDAHLLRHGWSLAELTTSPIHFTSPVRKLLVDGNAELLDFVQSTDACLPNVTVKVDRADLDSAKIPEHRGAIIISSATTKDDVDKIREFATSLVPVNGVERVMLASMIIWTTYSEDIERVNNSSSLIEIYPAGRAPNVARETQDIFHKLWLVPYIRALVLRRKEPDLALQECIEECYSNQVSPGAIRIRNVPAERKWSVAIAPRCPAPATVTLPTSALQLKAALDAAAAKDSAPVLFVHVAENRERSLDDVKSVQKAMDAGAVHHVALAHPDVDEIATAKEQLAQFRKSLAQGHAGPGIERLFVFHEGFLEPSMGEERAGAWEMVAMLREYSSSLVQHMKNRAREPRRRITPILVYLAVCPAQNDRSAIEDALRDIVSLSCAEVRVELFRSPIGFAPLALPVQPAPPTRGAKPMHRPLFTRLLNAIRNRFELLFTPTRQRSRNP